MFYDFNGVMIQCCNVMYGNTICIEDLVSRVAIHLPKVTVIGYLKAIESIIGKTFSAVVSADVSRH